MSIFASRSTKPFSVTAGDVTVTGTMQKLSWKSLQKARQAVTIENAEPLRAIGGEVLRAINSPALDEQLRELEEQLKKKNADPEAAHYAQYDIEETLVGAITGWDVSGGNRPTRAEILDLEEDIAKALRKEVIDYSDPYKPDAEAPKG
jgi:hypothetical protein